MSNMFRSRTGPLLIAAGLFGGLLYTTAGGSQQPRPATTGGQGGGGGVSETLQGIAGQGGRSARDEQRVENDPKDTRMATASPSADSKRNPQKVRGDLGGDDNTPGGGGQGKHIGDKGEGSGDLPWKKVGK
ncbi:hypothetical protein MFIFM68171_08441 [Madurella fahalii]|uniref:Uncharacterized protein n=1 Tax=Madurella fahalii TaxID=1157608 RepID=A0ABQ0GKI5_9PEZI